MRGHQPMNSSAIRGVPGHWRPAALWRASVAATALWAWSGALLCGADFALARQPPENPATAGPLPGSPWFLVVMLTFYLALGLAPSPALALITGLRYLRRVTLTGWQWRTAWIGACSFGIVTESVLLRAVAVVFAPGRGTAGTGPGQTDWGPVELSAGFLAAGAAMTAVLVIGALVERAHRARAPARS